VNGRDEQWANLWGTYPFLGSFHGKFFEIVKFTLLGSKKVSRGGAEEQEESAALLCGDISSSSVQRNPFLPATG
jgi:hypothetical protein